MGADALQGFLARVSRATPKGRPALVVRDRLAQSVIEFALALSK